MIDKQLVEDKIMNLLNEPMANHQIAFHLINDKKINPRKYDNSKFKEKIINPALRRLAKKDKIWGTGNVQNRRHMKIRTALNTLESEISELRWKIYKLEKNK